MTRYVILGSVFATVQVLAVSPALAHGEACDAKLWRHLLTMSLERVEMLDLPERFRVIYPDAAREIEPDPERLNLVVDEGSGVIDLYCG